MPSYAAIRVLVLRDLLDGQRPHVARLADLVEEELELGDVAHLEVLVRGRREPGAQRLAARRGERVGLAPPPAVLDRELEHPQLGEAVGLGVELGVREVPEVAHRMADRALEVVRRGGATKGDHAQNHVGRRGQPGSRHDVDPNDRGRSGNDRPVCDSPDATVPSERSDSVSFEGVRWIWRTALRWAAERYPDRRAVGGAGRRLGYREWDARTNRLARALRGSRRRARGPRRAVARRRASRWPASTSPRRSSGRCRSRCPPGSDPRSSGTASRTPTRPCVVTDRRTGRAGGGRGGDIPVRDVGEIDTAAGRGAGRRSRRPAAGEDASA